MSARLIDCNEAVVTINDDLVKGKIWVEVEVKIPVPDKGRHKFDADILSANSIKVTDKIGYEKLIHNIPPRLHPIYRALL
ncbi:MAG: hypothetical protein ABUL58_03580 [Steroidobacter sp.]